MISLQFGPHSNQVGSNRWNHQKQNQIRFPETNQQEPRILAFEINQKLAKEETENEDDEPLWEGNIQKIEKQTIDTPCLYNYTERQRVPLSLHLFNEQVFGFDIYQTGRKIGRTSAFLDSAFDENFRLYLEECDYLYGIETFCDIGDAYAGLACSFLEAVHDEIPKTPLILFGFENNRRLDSTRALLKHYLNTNWALKELSDLSSLYIPVNFNQQDNQGSLETDLAAAIETIHLPISEKLNMNSMVHLLNGNGQTKMVHLASCMPFTNTNNIIDQLCTPMQSFSTINVNADIMALYNVSRGIPHIDQELLAERMNCEVASFSYPSLPYYHSQLLEIPMVSRLVNSYDSFHYIHELVTPIQNLRINEYWEFSQTLNQEDIADIVESNLSFADYYRD